MKKLKELSWKSLLEAWNPRQVINHLPINTLNSFSLERVKYQTRILWQTKSLFSLKSAIGLAFPDSSWVWLFWYLLFSGGSSQISKGQLRVDWEFLTICVYVIRHDFVDKNHYFRNFLLFCVSSCPYKKHDKKLYLYIWENFIVIGRTLFWIFKS